MITGKINGIPEQETKQMFYNEKERRKEKGREGGGVLFSLRSIWIL